MKSTGNPDDNIRDLLSGLADADADAVRPLLVSLQSLSHDAAPTPSAALAAVLEGNASRQVARRRHVHRRTLFFSLALIGLLGAGAGTAAAVSPEFRSGAAHAIGRILDAIPFVPHPVAHPVPSGPPRVVHTPRPPAHGGATPRPARSPSGTTPAHGNGQPPSGHPLPMSTNHPGPPPKGPGSGAP